MRQQGCPDTRNLRTLAPTKPPEAPARMAGGESPPSLADLGRAVTLARNVRGWRQEDLAPAVRSDKSWICKVESGSVDFSMDNLERYVAALGIPLSLLAEAASIIRRMRNSEKEHNPPPGATHAFLAAGLFPSAAANLPGDVARFLGAELLA